MTGAAPVRVAAPSPSSLRASTLYIRFVPKKGWAGEVATPPALERGARGDPGTNPRESKAPPLQSSPPEQLPGPRDRIARQGSEDGT
jgi:hypothetical protein